MTRKTNREIVNRLRSLAKMETASFGFSTERVSTTGGPDGGKYDGQTVDEFIKERTRHWRQAWLLSLIDEIERRMCPSPPRKKGGDQP